MGEPCARVAAEWECVRGEEKELLQVQAARAVGEVGGGDGPKVGLGGGDDGAIEGGGLGVGPREEEIGSRGGDWAGDTVVG